MTCVHARVRGTSSAHPSHVDYNSYLECISARKWLRRREIWGRIKSVSDSLKRGGAVHCAILSQSLVSCTAEQLEERLRGEKEKTKKNRSLLWDTDKDDEWYQAGNGARSWCAVVTWLTCISTVKITFTQPEDALIQKDLQVQSNPIQNPIQASAAKQAPKNIFAVIHLVKEQIKLTRFSTFGQM